MQILLQNKIKSEIINVPGETMSGKQFYKKNCFKNSIKPMYTLWINLDEFRQIFCLYLGCRLKFKIYSIKTKFSLYVPTDVWMMIKKTAIINNYEKQDYTLISSIRLGTKNLKMWSHSSVFYLKENLIRYPDDF